MKACHDDTGHLGIERSLNLLKDRFYWPGITADMKNHVKLVIDVHAFKSKSQKTELYPITVTHLLELIYMHFLTTDGGKTGKDVNILVVTDHFM